MARELELKFRLKDEQLFFKRLEELKIVLSESILQKDIIFLKQGTEFDDLFKGEPVIRIREEQGKSKATVKKYVSGIMDREEIEFNLTEPEAFRRFLILLDFIPVIIVEKTRRKGIYMEATVTLDRVKGLGSFIEVEIISTDEIAETDKESLKNIVKRLGLDMMDLVKTPYDQMLYEKGEKDD